MLNKSESCYDKYRFIDAFLTDIAWDLRHFGSVVNASLRKLSADYMRALWEGFQAL